MSRARRLFRGHRQTSQSAARPLHSWRRSRQSGWSSATAARSHSAARRKWYTGTVSKYNTRSGTHTVDYDDVCAPPRLVLLCVAPEPCAVGQGESIVHDLSQTDYKLDDTDESGTVSALLPQVRRARPAPTAGPYSPKPPFCWSRTATASPFAGLALRPACASCGRTKTAT